MSRCRVAALTGGLCLVLGACASGGPAKLAAAGDYYAANYDSGIYGDPYGWKSVPYGYVGVGYGWADGYYYPGRGDYVYARDGARQGVTTAQRSYWQQRRHASPSETTDRIAVATPPA